MIFGGMRSALNLTYSQCFNKLYRYMLPTSPVNILAPGVEIVLFTSILVVSSDAVYVATSPSYGRRSPPAVIRVLYFSSFSGQKATVYLAYVTFLSFGTSALCIHSSTSIPLTSLYPWNNLPNSFSPDSIQRLCISGFGCMNRSR